jgi:Protein of unknown function (DUF4199)
MGKFILRYGIIAGLIASIPWIGYMYWLPPDAKRMGGMLQGYLIIIVALSMVFVGIRQYRNQRPGGAITFGRAFLLGLGISAVASILYAIGWEVAQSVSRFDFMAFYAKTIPDPVQAREFVRNYSNPAYRMAFTFIEMFPVGILVSLISAGILRRT